VLDLLEATFRRNKLRLKQDLIEDLLLFISTFMPQRMEL